MNQQLYIANWKSNKTTDEARQFFKQLKDSLSGVDLGNTKLVVAPPFTLLKLCKDQIVDYNLPVSLAAQNVSSFPPGAYTGEIHAGQVREFADFVIIGHSERRTYQHESESDLENKIYQAKEVGLTIIQCVQDENSVIHNGVDIVAFEPPSAIGSGNPDDPGHIGEVFKRLKEQSAQVTLLYGGSVKPENIDQYKSIEGLQGFLVGGASLDAGTFISLLNG